MLGQDVRFLNPQDSSSESQLRAPDMKVRTEFLDWLISIGALKGWPDFIDTNGKSVILEDDARFFTFSAISQV